MNIEVPLSYTIPLYLIGTLIAVCVIGAAHAAVLALTGNLPPSKAVPFILAFGIFVGINTALFFNQLSLIEMYKALHP